MPVTIVKKVAGAPAPEDIPVGLALKALSANGLYVTGMSQAARATPDDFSCDVTFRFMVFDKKGAEALASLLAWAATNGKEY